MMKRCNGVAPQSRRITSTRTAAFRALEPDSRLVQNYPSAPAASYVSDESELDRRQMLMRMAAGASVLAWGSAMAVAQPPARPMPPSVPKATVPTGIAFSQVRHALMMQCALYLLSPGTADSPQAACDCLLPFLCVRR